MTRTGLLRTTICSTASMIGLWAVASGFLTHHPIAMKIGAGVALVGALLVFTGEAEASNFDGLPPPMASVQTPIKRAPIRYQLGAVLTIHTMPSYEVADVCRTILGAASADLACERNGVAYLPNPCEFRGDRYADLLCHETAHAEGWGPNHPMENDR